MPHRLSADEALKAGLITATDHAEMKQAEKGSAKSKTRRRQSRSRGATGSVSPPQKLLFDAIEQRWPSRFTWELSVKPPGATRAYSLDVASVDDRLCIEMDGWQYHGKHKGDFQRDRIRQNRLCLDGWRILRFFPGQVYADMNAVLEQIETALAWRKSTTGLVQDL